MNTVVIGFSPQSDISALYEAHQGLVEKTVSYLLSRRPLTGLERADLLQEARLGLWDAAQRFDPKRGVTFRTFATHCIINALRHALARQQKWADHVMTGTHLLTLEDLSVEGVPSHDKEAEAKVTCACLLSQLSQRDRAAVTQHLLRGESKVAVARELGVSKMHAGRIISGALKRIQLLAGA